MNLEDELQHAAAAGRLYGAVCGVLAAEPVPGERAYLVALGEDDERQWLVLGENLEPIAERDLVREVASIVILCELAVELAAGDHPEDSHANLSDGEAETGDGFAAAAAELERVIGIPPRIASGAYLDRVGAATRRLEQELGQQASPLAQALAAHTPSVEAFVAEVEDRHRVRLR